MSLQGVEGRVLLGREYYKRLLFTTIARPYSSAAECWDHRPHQVWDLLLLARVTPPDSLALRFNFRWESRPETYFDTICANCGTLQRSNCIHPVTPYCSRFNCIDSIPGLPVPKGALSMIFQSIPYWHRQEVLELQTYIYKHHKSKNQKSTTTIK